MFDKTAPETAPAEKRVTAMRCAVGRELRAELGTGYAQALRDAQTLVNRHPRLRRMLEESGAGDAPLVVKAFVAMARLY